VIVYGCMSLLVRTVRGRGAESFVHSSIIYTPRLSLLPPFAAPKEILVPCLENYSGVHAVLPSVLGPRIRLVRARVTMRTPVHANNVTDGCRQLPCVP
jgi:hypothetical protein